MQYPSLYRLALSNSKGSSGRILAQAQKLEAIAQQLTDTHSEHRVTVSLPSYPQYGRVRVRVVDSAARHKPINGGIIYTVVTAWREYEWINKEIRWTLGSDYIPDIDDTTQEQLERAIQHTQTEQLIRALQHKNVFTESHPDLLLSTAPFHADRLEQIAQHLPSQIPCPIVAIGDGEAWCNNPNNIRHILDRCSSESERAINAVGLYRLLNGSMQHSDRTIAHHWSVGEWHCAEFLLKARYNPQSMLVQLVSPTRLEDKAINSLCCQLLPLLQDNATVIETSRVDVEELGAALNSYAFYITDGMRGLHSEWLGGLEDGIA